MKIKIIQNIKSIILALILVVGVSYVSAASVWKNPTSNPPLNNANIPLNTSSTGQSKAGGLTLNTGGAANGLIVDKGLTILRGGLQVPTGAGVGKVLTSDASGNATWGAVAETGTGIPADFTETAVNFAEDVYGSWVASSCGGRVFFNVECASSFDTCNSSSTTDYACGVGDGKICTDYTKRNEYISGQYSSDGVYRDVYYNRTVTCKKVTVMMKVY